VLLLDSCGTVWISVVAEWEVVGYNGVHVGESGKSGNRGLNLQQWDGAKTEPKTPVLSACGSETVRGICLNLKPHVRSLKIELN
jgi:hypothetical protein